MYDDDAVAKRPVKLFWYKTFGGDRFEDWFVLARTERRAKRWVSFAEGLWFYSADVQVEEICTLPSAVQESGREQLDSDGGGWPDDEILTACGAEWVQSEEPRIVKLDGRTFVEGGSPAERLERRLVGIGQNLSSLLQDSDGWCRRAMRVLEDVEGFATSSLPMQPEATAQLTQVLERAHEVINAVRSHMKVEKDLGELLGAVIPGASARPNSN